MPHCSTYRLYSPGSYSIPDSSAGSKTLHNANDLENLFRDCFFDDFSTQLSGGHSEPLYLPARGKQKISILQYRENYFSSALHETAHWCIAGEQRRKQMDFGYWYEPDGRNAIQQSKFEVVEIKPQAVEWIFSVAAGRSFQVSADNLQAGREESNTGFTNAVYRQVLIFISKGLPPRAARFTETLASFYKTANPLDSRLYQIV